MNQKPGKSKNASSTFRVSDIESRDERKPHEQDNIVELIEEMSESGGTKEAVVEEWMKVNEKKKTAFYQRLKELPEDWQRRFREIPDKRSTAEASRTHQTLKASPK
jgi:hypothetical protein